MAQLALLLFGLVGALQGQPAGPLTFRVATTDGPTGPVPLLGMADDFVLKLGGAAPVARGPAEWLALRRDGVPLPPGPPPPFVLLSAGDRVPLARVGAFVLQEEQLRIEPAAPLRPAAGTSLTVPQARLAAVCLALPPGVADVEHLLPRDESKPARPGDALILRNGDRLEGTLTRLDDRGATLIQADRKVDLPLDRIAVVAFNPELQSRTPPRKTYARTVLRSGARVRFIALASEGRSLRGTLASGGRLTLPLDELIALQLRQGRAVYLDDLRPLTYEATPFLDLPWPLAVNRTLLGGPLRLGDDVYDAGLAMHSRSRVTYALDGSYGAFEATVAVDARAGPRAAVRLGVELDGKPVPDAARPLKAGDPPSALRVDTRGARRLTLVTDFGPLGDVQGHALWADARLVRKN